MRGAVILLAIAGAAAIVYFAPDDDGAVAAPARPAAPVRPVARALPAAAPVDSEHLTIRARSAESDLGNAFGERGWSAPPARAVQPAAIAEAAAPAAPQAPPLPFTFLGRMVDGGAVAYFLEYGERVLVVRPGQTVDQTYSFDSVGAGALTFTFLPLKQQQTLTVGEVN